MKFVNLSDWARLFKSKWQKRFVLADKPVSVCNTSIVPMQIGHLNLPPNHAITFYNSAPSITGAYGNPLGGLMGHISGGALGGLTGLSGNSVVTNQMINGI